MGVKLYLGEYDFEGWLRGAKGLECESEKGKRCEFCFDYRMENTAKFAQKIGEKSITTTLLMSPKKSHDQLTKSLEKICANFGLCFVAPDFRKNGGTNEQFAMAKRDNLYHQNYCGCMFALNSNKEFSYELTSPLDRQILPNSIEDKRNFYENVRNLEAKGEKFKIVKDKFLNYRLLNFKILFDTKVAPSFVIFNSHFKREQAKFSIDKSCEIFYAKDEIKLVKLSKMNEILGLNYKNVSEILKQPLSLEEQEILRVKMGFGGGFSPIIIVDEIPNSRVEIQAKSDTFWDVREILVRI